ncbi:MAG: hypothetical protein DMD91_31870 [Candidatus Rokuibacteriota bacterium]|nr:MAG: hypothetical protein DMD91_31870 [Candidatus Rokubacteria bacterium]
MSSTEVTMTSLLTITFTLLALLAIAGPVGAADQLGEVSFTTSCAPAVQKDFRVFRQICG